MQRWFSTWAALEPNCFAKANVRTRAALQYDEACETCVKRGSRGRRMGLSMSSGEGVRRRE
jgi:hypothetical protein